jgi:hypothetical protein
MSNQPPDANAAPQQGTDPAASGATTTGQTWRNRAWSLPAVVAVALASVLLGGLGGAALANVSDDGRDGRFGPGHSRFQRDGDMRRPGMMNERQRERWREWRQEQRRQLRQDGMPRPTGTSRPTPYR